MLNARHIAILTLASRLFIGIATAQESGPYQPIGQIPPVGVAKYDPGKPTILQFRIPELHYIKMATEITNNGQTKTQSYSQERLGKMIPMDLPLTDIQFITIQGKPLAANDVLKRMVKPTHVFYGFAPEEFYTALISTEAIVIVATKDKRLPQPPRNLHLD